jgi:hypothetical protein
MDKEGEKRGEEQRENWKCARGRDNEMEKDRETESR